MPDGYGPDFLSRSMFFREAEAGPSQQELATMTAPFMGSPEQARALYQSPEVQARLQHFGLGGFSPDMIRQSPFLPNQLMQGHPLLGGMLNRAMANAAATPEAPLVSGAGSGISRAMQGMYGGPELLRQYQVRQLMAPFQAMGMQLPIMAEQRRQELLQALEQDMQKRQAMEQQQLQMRQQQGLDKLEATRPVSTPWGWLQPTMGTPGQPAGPMGTVQPQVPTQPGMPNLDALIAPQLFGGQGGFQAPTTPAVPPTPMGWEPHVLTPEQIGAAGGMAVAQHPERPAAAGLAGERAAELGEERGLGMPAARVAAEQGLAVQRKGSANYNNARAAWQRFNSQFAAQHGGMTQGMLEKFAKDYDKNDQDTAKAIQALERASKLPAGTTGAVDPELARTQIAELNRQREQAKTTMDRARGVAPSPQGSSVPWNPNANLPTALPAPSSKPGAGGTQIGRGGQAGGAGSQQSQGTATAPQVQW